MDVNSPEVFLKSFNNKILELLNSSEILENSDIKKKLQLIYRKLSVSEILFEKYIISISGLQGVGKTTLIKQIYSIPDEFLPENIGRGEQLPVLITESDVKEIALNVIRLKEENQRYITVTENIEKEEFFKISKDPNPSDLILEMKVPNKIFNSENKSFLLLPGFEDTKNEREDLVYHSLISSASCLFLFNATGFASKSNKNVLEDINIKFENAKPIFLATFSDESQDENEGLKKNLIETFNLQNEEDRVICVGTGKYKNTSTERIDDWLPKLKQSLSKYSNTTAQFRKSQMKNLQSIVEDEVGLILEEIEEVNGRKNLKIDVRQLKVKEPLEILDKQIKKIRHKYSKKLGQYLDGFTVKPLDGIKDIVVKESYIKKLKKVTIGSSLRDIRTFENHINDCWNTSNGYGINELHAVVLNDLLSKEFKFHKDLKLTPGVERKELLGDFTQPENTEFIVRQETLDDVITLFQPDNKISENFSDKFNSSIKVFPLLYMDILRIATIEPNHIEVGEHDSSPNDKIQEIFGDAEFLKSKSSLIGPAVTAILGIDAIDGQMDTVGALSSALGVSSATIATSLVAGAGVIGAGIFVKSVITQINKAEIEDTAMANTVIQGLKDRYFALYISNYDDIMDELRDFIEDKLMERHHLDKGVGRREFLLKTIANVREDKYQLSQQLNRQLIL